MTYSVQNVHRNPSGLQDRAVPYADIPAGRRIVFWTMVTTLAIELISTIDPNKVGSEGVTGHIRPAFSHVNIFAWAGLFIVLTWAADLQPTSKLASAFSFAIMFGVLYKRGPQAMTNLQNLVNNNQPAQPAPKGGHTK